MGNTFKGGKDKPHNKVKMGLPKLPLEVIELIAQLKEVHKEFGDDGAKNFIEETEKRSNLKKGDLSHLLLFVKFNR